MQTQDDYSYGVIPLLRESGVWKVFLINQYGSAGDVYWTFPKGHPEEGESPQESALRELLEETGITLARLFESKTYTQEYSFRYADTTINKKVVYYLGIADTPLFSIQEDEIKEAGWFTFAEAFARVTFEHAKVLLEAIKTEVEHL